MTGVTTMHLRQREIAAAHATIPTVNEMFPHGWFHLSKWRPWRPWLIAAAVVYAIFTFPLFPGSDLITKLGWSAAVVIATAARRKILAWVRSEETRK
jgi:hypothetical protein